MTGEDQQQVGQQVRVSSSRFRRYPLVVTFEGPDGAGKSTLATDLARWCANRGIEVRTARSRPKSSERLRTTEYDHERPHETRERGLVESSARVVLKFGFYLARWAVEARPTRRPTILIRERGWLDYDVDARRYGLARPTRHLVRVLGKLFPKSDYSFVLVGDPAVIHERKADLTVDDISSVIERWKRVAPDTAREVVLVDTTANSPESALGELLTWLVVERSSTTSGRSR